MAKRNGLARKPTATLVEIQERTVETAAMLLDFKSRRYIIDFLVDKYGLHPRSVDAIITKGYAYIKDNYKHDRDSIVVKHLEFYYDLAMQHKDVDPRASLNPLEQIEKLLRLHQEQPLISHQTLNLNMENVSDEQLRKAIESIKTIRDET